ncbi:MAG: DUF523 domain-containing protein [Sarcina sp.]
MILVSACLLGENCKYNGGNNKSNIIIEYLKGKEFIKICPEELGGLKTPRNPAEIIGSANLVLKGKNFILNNNGQNVTKEFVKGAVKSLEIAKVNNCNMAILKSNSPSCGKGIVYDGTFNNIKIKGNGITTQLLLDNKIEVLTENEVSIKK